MQISDQGIILSVRKYSESSLIIKILSQNHGVYSGFIRNSKSTKTSAFYHQFNLVDFEWRSRISNNLGFFKIELKKSFLGDIISSPIKLSSLGAIAIIIEQNSLEREEQQEIFDGLLHLLQNLNSSNDLFLSKYIKFEIELLRILGYGIDLSECVATGATTDLVFVSPKSARAVSKQAGEKYQNKLLTLPQFLLSDNHQINKEDLLNGLKLSGFFIEKYLSDNSKTNSFSSRNQLVNLIS